jgi:hypothetical protein
MEIRRNDRMTRQGHGPLMVVALSLLMLPGCAESDGSTAAPPPERQRFIASSEPKSATSIARAKASVAQQSGEVVFVGQILDSQFNPFQEGQASFVLSELPDDGHAHKGHDPKDCPFCKRRAAKAPKAIVQCKDESGKLLPIDARTLLGVAPDQVIVVRGKAKVDPALDLFLVEAERVFIRR